MARPATSTRERTGRSKSPPATEARPAPPAKQPGCRAQPEPREQGQHVAAPAEPAALPPEYDEEGRRQRRRDGLAQQRACEERQRDIIGSGPARLVKLQVDQGRGEVQGKREGVLLLRNPGDRLD